MKTVKQFSRAWRASKRFNAGLLAFTYVALSLFATALMFGGTASAALAPSTRLEWQNNGGQIVLLIDGNLNDMTSNCSIQTIGNTPSVICGSITNKVVSYSKAGGGTVSCSSDLSIAAFPLANAANVTIRTARANVLGGSLVWSDDCDDAMGSFQLAAANVGVLSASAPPPSSSRSVSLSSKHYSTVSVCKGDELGGDIAGFRGTKFGTVTTTRASDSNDFSEAIVFATGNQPGNGIPASETFAITSASGGVNNLTVNDTTGAIVVEIIDPEGEDGENCIVSVDFKTSVSLANGEAVEVCAQALGKCGTVAGDATSLVLEGEKPADLGDPSPVSCETEGGEMSWLICPVLRQIDNAIEALDREINGLLTIPNDYFGNPQLKATWARIRNISYIILVPVLLIMVVSTALGFDFISAYTVKKALPRLVAAILFIALSYELTTFMIEIVNDIGRGIGGLLTSSFAPDGSDGNITLASLFNSSGALDAGLFVGILYGAVGAVAITSMGIIMSYALVTLVALLVGFVALSFRQMLVVALILLAPLAILAWIFPGNDKLWKLWWGAFSKLLLLYPLIMLMVGGGRVFARVVQMTTEAGGGPQFGNTDVVSTLLKLTAYVGPYFFIPTAFKFAGGLFATISGMANDRSRGLFDGQRKKRAEARAHLRDKSGAGHRFNPNRRGITGAIGRGLNKTSGWAVDPKNSAAIAMGTQGGKRLAAELTQKSAAQSQDLAKWLSQAGFNQEALTAIMDNSKKNHGHLNMSELNRVAGEWAMGGSTQEKAAGKQLLNSGQFLSNLTNSEEYSRAHVGMAAGLAKGAQGFLNSSNVGEIAEYSNALNKYAPGLGDTFKTQAGLMNAQAGGLSKVGYSEQVDENGKYVAGGTSARAIQLTRVSVQDLAGAKASQITKNFVETGAVREIMNADTSDGKSYNLMDAETGEVVKVNEGKQQAVIDNLAQAAYGYNTPAETASVLRQQLNDYVGSVDDKGVATTGTGRMVQKAVMRASRIDPKDNGGLDVPPRAPEE